jgi:A/G-specific adenine glycosylase
MDLGASLCSKSRPQCLLCPAQHLCEAHRLQTATDFPVKTKKLTRKTAVWWLCVLRAPNGSTWLEKRPARGIWAGLYSLPVFDSLPALQDKVGTLLGRLAVLGQHPVIRHSLTHRDLVLHPVEVQLEAHEMGLLTPSNTGEGVWVGQAADLTMGLPAPLKVWLAQTLKE